MQHAGYIRDAATALRLIPVEGSANAHSVDMLFFYLLAMSGAAVLLIGATIFFFCIRYRAGAEVNRSTRLTERREHWMELGWTLPTFAVFLSFFYWGAALYIPDYRPPPDAVQVDVVGKQWMWKIQHANGVREIDTLHVPVGEKVKLRIASEDVIHSFFIPAFRLKQDAVPGRVTTYWFKATRPGTYELECAEYCGRDHSRMRGRVIAMTPASYANWLARQPRPGAAVMAGERLYRALGCSGCHEPASSVHAPSFDGIYGGPVHLMSGATRIVDDAYIRDSILLPNKDVVAGYKPVMPSFKGQASGADIEKLIAYIKWRSGTTEARP